MALQVIGAGFGRTGTMSLQAALEKLGYEKCHHMTEIFPSAKQTALWADIAAGKPPDWDAIFDGYAASVDFPSSIFYKELAEKYPEAKVILTTRAPDKWYESATATIYAISHAIPGWMKLIPRLKDTSFFVHKIIWTDFFDGKFEDKDAAIAHFNHHIDEVKRTIPPDRLLVMEVKQGWAPLCTFLGKEIPDEEFPNVNDTEEFRQRIRVLNALSWVPWALGGIGLGIAAYALS